MQTADGFKASARRDDGAYRARMLDAFERYFASRYGVPPQQAGYRRDTFDQNVLSASRAGGGSASEAQLAIHPQYRFLELFVQFREIMARQKLGVAAHVIENSLNMSNYVSTSRSAFTAKYFVRRGGWVYVTHVPFGFVIPVRGSAADVDNVAKFTEQEVVVPESLSWATICGYRKVADFMFTGAIYLRHAAVAEDREAMERVYNLLCGEPQSNAPGSRI